MMYLKSLLVAAALAVTAFAAPAHADSASLSFVSEPGDYIGLGMTRSYTSGLSTTVSTDNRVIGVSVWAGNEWWYLDIAAPVGEKLHAGAYEGATRYPFNASTEPGLSMSGSGRACNTLTGRFDVTEATYSSDGKSLVGFTANFEQHCEGMTPALFGRVHVQRDPPPPALEIALVITDRGNVNGKTGEVVVFGQVTCTKPASFYLNGQVSQRVTRFALAQGGFNSQVQCGTTPTKWSSTVHPFQVPFGQGSASVDATATGFDPDNYQQVSATQGGVVHLMNVKK